MVTDFPPFQHTQLLKTKIITCLRNLLLTYLSFDNEQDRSINSFILRHFLW